MTDTSQTPESISVFAGPSPKVRRIGLDQPWSWLTKGWQDLRRAPAVGLSYGVLFSVAGVVLLTAIWFLDIFVLVLPLTAGFMLMGPILAVGLLVIVLAAGNGAAPRVSRAGDVGDYQGPCALARAPGGRGTALRG